MIPLGVLASRRESSPAIEFVGANVSNATSISVPTHQTGDLLVMFATGPVGQVPSLPSGWTSIGTSTSNGPGGRLAYRVATASGTTSGTWTYAQLLQVVVYRGQHPTTPIGAYSFRPSGVVGWIYYPALTGMQTAGSWVLCGVDHRRYDPSVAWPSGLTKRADLGLWGGVADAPATSWSLSPYMLTDGESRYLSFSLEIRGG